MGNYDKLFSAFDYIDEIIYVADMENYDLIYCNEKTKKLLVSDEYEDEKGFKCYACLQGLDYPCVFCNNAELKEHKCCIWTRQNSQTGKHYLIHDAVISLDGKEYRMELAVDASHIEKSAAHTQKMLEMESHLTDCVRHLIKSGDFSESVDAVLQTVLNYYAGESAYTFEFDREHNTVSNTYEICAPQIESLKKKIQDYPVNNIQPWVDEFEKQSVLFIENIDDYKGMTAKDIVFNGFKQGESLSILAVPIYTEGKLSGYVGVDNPKQNLDNFDFLANLAYFLGAEIDKNKIIEELEVLSYQDAITGVYNRKKFDQVTNAMKADALPFGFAMLDIDNFKMFNDTYGHQMGDVVLKETAQMLVGVFGNDDMVFRLGGDEFGLLLRNSDASSWKGICSKIQWFHSAMSEKHPEMVITLSLGVTFSNEIYSPDLFQIADEALYETKKNGRAGCTMIDLVSKEKKYWSDDSLSSFYKNVLEHNSTGMFRIEYPLDVNGNSKGVKESPKMFCGEVVREIFAIPSDASPKECYELWKKGISPAYTQTLLKTREILFGGVQSECTYQWNHPTLGNIFVRTIGVGEIKNGVQNLYGYHHSLKDTRIVEKQDDTKLLLNAISSIYFGSYYLNIENDSYYTIKNGPNENRLQVKESNAAASLENFVQGLVHPDNQAKMRKFVDLKTLAKRMKKERHLDCEYYSVAEKSWCRATFIPVRYDTKGNVTHALFQVTPLDKNRVQELELNEQNKKTVESLFNAVPGGLVLYEWDKKRLKTLQISKYYEEQYGSTLKSSEGDNVGGPDFGRVHPDDVADYKKAIMEALTKTHQIEYVYRAWNKMKNRYVWVKIQAVSEDLQDGHSLVYAMYSDVTGQKEAELGLLKKRASLIAALRASDQLSYEYDPVTRIEECLTEDNIFHLPKVMQNYPYSILDIVHIDDRQSFLDTVHKMENGAKEAECDVRLKKDDSFVWYSCSFCQFFDSAKDRNVIIISAKDISEHIATLQSYEARMQMMLNVTKDALSIGILNVTNNTFTLIRSKGDVRKKAIMSSTLDEFFENTAKSVMGEKEQEQYIHTFSCANLLSMIAKGQMHVHMEHLYRTSSKHIEWIRTNVDLLNNPITGEIVGVCYSKSMQNTRLSNALLQKVLKRDYPLASVVYVENDEYYLFNAEKDQYCVHKQDFWENITQNLESAVAKDTIEVVKKELTKEKVFEQLNQNKSFYYAFDSILNGKICRLEVKISFLDERKEMLLATLRDITDSVILEKLRHDNERDHLTDLYNRRKTFAVCRKLLNEHPDDQFAMLHFDIRHFRLYNTFFGDVAGDKLLCDIADMFRNMDKDYDYWAYGRIESDVFCVFFPINQNKYQKHLDDLLHGLSDYRPDFLIEPAIGIYVVKDKQMSMESMFTRASIAAKTIKTAVTDSIVFYNDEMEQNMLDEQQVLNDMQGAVEEEQFKVYLQPKYDLSTRKAVGAEALVRWEHPLKGLISPGKFIPVFERNGYIATLDRYMWEKTCQLLQKWKQEGKKLMPVSVNVSRISMYSQTTVPFLKQLVKKYDLEPKYLELELTESAYMDDPDEMKKQLRELQDYGFHILMDDFGSGYSSLNTLRELPVDCLKLDMRFLSESSTDERGRVVLSSVIQMSKLLKLEIIAEGVETKEQADFLKSLQCEYVQGFLFAKPMPAQEYEKQVLMGKSE